MDDPTVQVLILDRHPFWRPFLLPLLSFFLLLFLLLVFLLFVLAEMLMLEPPLGYFEDKLGVGLLQYVLLLDLHLDVRGLGRPCGWTGLLDFLKKEKYRSILLYNFKQWLRSRA